MSLLVDSCGCGNLNSARLEQGLGPEKPHVAGACFSEGTEMLGSAPAACLGPAGQAGMRHRMPSSAQESANPSSLLPWGALRDTEQLTRVGHSLPVLLELWWCAEKGLRQGEPCCRRPLCCDEGAHLERRILGLGCQVHVTC